MTIARDLGLDRSQIVAIGDGHNDIGMIEFAGLGVAMGNAHDEVKKAGRSCDEQQRRGWRCCGDRGFDFAGA